MTKLFAISDIHVSARENAELIARLSNPTDWLIVAGDIAENGDQIIATLATLRTNFARVIWAPGNHELAARIHSSFRGRQRYSWLISRARDLGVDTPEDPFPVFYGTTICPLFLLYDYTLGDVESSKAQGFELIDEATITPYVDIVEWSRERLATSVRKLSRVEGPTVLVNHWPLEPDILNDVEIPIHPWCGTVHTHGWAQRFHAKEVVYGHLHIPRRQIIQGVHHIEVSLGYPRQWHSRSRRQSYWPLTVVEER